MARTELFSRRQPGGMFSVVDVQEHPGSIFFVHSGTGTDAAGYGRNPDAPVATIDYAIGLCAASKGDVIFVLPGHAETVSGAAGINCDVAGVKIIGLGWGAQRPTITMSAVASTIAIAAAGITLRNLLILSTAACTIVIDVNSTDADIDGCEFRRTSGTVPVVWIDVNGGAANACDRTRIRNCVLDTGTNVGATGFVELGEVANGVEIRGCKVFGDFGDACIHNPTGKILTNLVIADCELTNLQTGDHSIELVSACTGNLIRNLYHTDMTQQTGADPGSCFSFECYQDDVIDTSAILTPVVT